MNQPSNSAQPVRLSHSDQQSSPGNWNHLGGRRKFLKRSGVAGIGMVLSSSWALADDQPASSLEVTDFTYDIDLDIDDNGKATKINSLKILSGKAAWYNENAAPPNLAGSWCVSVEEDTAGTIGLSDGNSSLTGSTDSTPKTYNPNNLKLENLALPGNPKSSIMIRVGFSDGGQNTEDTTKKHDVCKFLITDHDIRSLFTPGTASANPKFELKKANSLLKLAIKGGPGAGNMIAGKWKLKFSPNSGSCANPAEVSDSFYGGDPEHIATSVVDAWYKEYEITPGAGKLTSVNCKITFTPDDSHWKGDSKSFTIDCDGITTWRGSENYKYKATDGNWPMRLASNVSDNLWNVLGPIVMSNLRQEMKARLMARAMQIGLHGQTPSISPENQAEFDAIQEVVNEILNDPTTFDNRNEASVKASHSASLAAEIRAKLGNTEKTFGVEVKAEENGAKLSHPKLLPNGGPATAVDNSAISWSFGVNLGNGKNYISINRQSSVSYNTSWKIETTIEKDAEMKMSNGSGGLIEATNHQFDVSGKSDATFVTVEQPRVSISQTRAITGNFLETEIPETQVQGISTWIDKAVGTLSSSWGGDNNGHLAVKLAPP